MDNADAPALFDSAFLAKLEQLHLLSRKLFSGKNRAERRSRHTGASPEFADYRHYALGDDLRSIDWNIYGRLDRLFVKLFEAEQDLPIYLLIDSSASMTWQPAPGEERPIKFDQSRRIAAALAYIGLANLDRVNIAWFSDTLHGDTGLTRGKSQFHKVLEFLRYAPAQCGVTALSDVMRSFVSRMRHRGLVIVLSDFFDPAGAESALSILRYNRFDVFAVQVLDPAEIAPPLSGDIRLMDQETGAIMEITATGELLKRYAQEFQAAQDRLRRLCRERSIGFVSATTASPFEDLVLEALRGGALLK